MRSAFLLSFALISSAAFAQARTVSAVAPETAMTAGISSASTAAAAATVTLPRPALHQDIRASITPGKAADAFHTPQETLAYTFGRSSNVVAPRLIQVHSLPVQQQDLATLQHHSAKVAVQMLVDRQGVPQNLSISRSAGKTIDEAALNTVKNYRFTPASINNDLVEAPVTVTVTINE